MAIYEQMAGAPGAGGRVVLICKRCMAPAQDAKSTKILKVCSKCGTPLGEWENEAERDAELKDYVQKIKDAGTPSPVARLFEIRITSGNYAGRYVGTRFGGGGYVSNPEVRQNPPVNVEGTEYGLWGQQGTSSYFEAKAVGVQAELKKLGYETELIQVQG